MRQCFNVIIERFVTFTEERRAQRAVAKSMSAASSPTLGALPPLAMGPTSTLDSPAGSPRRPESPLSPTSSVGSLSGRNSPAPASANYRGRARSARSLLTDDVRESPWKAHEAPMFEDADERPFAPRADGDGAGGDGYQTAGGEPAAAKSSSKCFCCAIV